MPVKACTEREAIVTSLVVGGGGSGGMQTPFVCYFSVPFWEKLVFVSESLALPLDVAATQRSSVAVAFPLCSRTWNNGVSPGPGRAALPEFANLVSRHGRLAPFLQALKCDGDPLLSPSPPESRPGRTPESARMIERGHGGIWRGDEK